MEEKEEEDGEEEGRREKEEGEEEEDIVLFSFKALQMVGERGNRNRTTTTTKKNQTLQKARKEVRQKAAWRVMPLSSHCLCKLSESPCLGAWILGAESVFLPPAEAPSTECSGSQLLCVKQTSNMVFKGLFVFIFPNMRKLLDFTVCVQCHTCLWPLVVRQS